MMVTLKTVRLFMIQRVWSIASLLPFMNARLAENIFRSIPLVTAIAWSCSLCSMLAWWGYYGASLQDVTSLQGFITHQDPRQDVGVFEAHLPIMFLYVR